MKYILISLTFLVSSVAFGSFDSPAEKTAYVLSSARKSLEEGNTRMFKNIMNMAIKSLAASKDSSDPRYLDTIPDQIEAAYDLLESAEPSLDSASYDELLQQVQSL